MDPRNKLQASFHLDDERFPFVFPANWSPTTAIVFENSKPTPGLSYTGVLSEKTILEVRYSGFYGNTKVGPLDPDQLRDLPAIYNLDTGCHSGGWGYWYEVLYYMNGLSYGYGGGGQTFSYSGDVRRIGAFLDDTVRVSDRLSFNLGLRFDHETAFAREHDLVDDQGRPTGVRVPNGLVFRAMPRGLSRNHMLA